MKIRICPKCKGCGTETKQECDQGGGNNGSDYWYSKQVKCNKCKGSGRVYLDVKVKPYKPERVK